MGKKNTQSRTALFHISTPPQTHTLQQTDRHVQHWTAHGMCAGWPRQRSRPTLHVLLDLLDCQLSWFGCWASSSDGTRRRTHRDNQDEHTRIPSSRHLYKDVRKKEGLVYVMVFKPNLNWNQFKEGIRQNTAMPEPNYNSYVVKELCVTVLTSQGRLGSQSLSSWCKFKSPINKGNEQRTTDVTRITRDTTPEP